MSRRSTVFWASVFGVLLVIGYWQLLDNNLVFAQSDLPCCNLGNCVNRLCTLPTSANVQPTCDGVTISCFECVKYTQAGMICYGAGSPSCIAPDGSLYTGEERSTTFLTIRP
jgi:hypothetical protein